MKHLASTTRLAALVVMAGGMFTHPAAAAPFCLNNQVLPPQCIYYDAQECDRDARHQGAVCSANPAELRLTRSVGDYCVVTSSQASVCAYPDRQSCSVEAARQQGICVTASKAPTQSPDPYSTVNGR
ncbi:MAG: hypothetical protein P4L90_27270 [Rhodopila sp.]|nr:hypothetical protein [Rhodopila sp.]